MGRYGAPGLVVPAGGGTAGQENGRKEKRQGNAHKYLVRGTLRLEQFLWLRGGKFPILKPCDFDDSFRFVPGKPGGTPVRFPLLLDFFFTGFKIPVFVSKGNPILIGTRVVLEGFSLSCVRFTGKPFPPSIIFDARG